MLTLDAFLQRLKIPAERFSNTYFQWGNTPAGTEGLVLASLSVVDHGDGIRRVCVDYENREGEDISGLETEVPIKEDGTFDMNSGELVALQLQAFADAVEPLDLIVIAEA